LWLLASSWLDPKTIKDLEAAATFRRTVNLIS
jgi:hypothetical protein